MTARLLVDLDAFARNLEVIRRRIAPAEHMLVVKDDAYGHGLIPIVRRAWAEGVRWFGAFDTATGLAVRDALGADARVFVWLLGDRTDVADAVAADLDLGVGDAALLDELSALSPVGARLHLKIDTGLHRNGIRPEEWAGAIERTVALERAGTVRLEGVWSHLAEASDAEDDTARRTYLEAVGQVRSAGLNPRMLHLAASAAGFTRPGFRHDLVRIGAFAYGIAPAGGPDAATLGIEPISGLVAEVVGVDGKHAHLGVGSLDGLPSTLAGLISVRSSAGVRRVIRIDPTRTVVEGWPSMRPGEDVNVVGAGSLHSLTDAAERLGTIGEELALRISPLVERAYLPIA